MIIGAVEVDNIIAKLTDYSLILQNNFFKSQLWVLLPIESAHLPSLINTYAVRGRTKVLRGGSRQRWSREHKARGQGQGHKKNPRPRPRTALPRTDTLEAKDRNARGQGPRTQAESVQKKGLQNKFF